MPNYKSKRHRDKKQIGWRRMKGKTGNASRFMTRTRALGKLQLSLAQFRKLCILTGVYPRDPAKKLRGSTSYFHKADIAYLMAHPLVDTFRDQKSHVRKVVKAKAKDQNLQVIKLQRSFPREKLDVVVKERYPTFASMLGDLDDCMCMLHLFAMHPAHGRISAKRLALIARLCHEFQCYVIRARALRKVFVSIKGVYYQADIMGETVIWLAPHQFVQPIAADVDYTIMNTFLQLYENVAGFALFRLYQDMGLVFPPSVSQTLMDQDNPLDAILQGADDDDDEDHSLDDESGDDDEEEEEEEEGLGDLDVMAIARKQDDQDRDEKEAVAPTDNEDNAEFVQLAIDDATRLDAHALTRPDATSLFSGLVVFLAREVSRSTCEFALRAFGAAVSWPGGPFDEDDKNITHHIVDRPQDNETVRLGRHYVQPQWIFDSINFEALMPLADYAPGATLPPHLSPFVDDAKEGYVPDFKARIDRLVMRAHEHRAALEAAGEAKPGAALTLDAVAADDHAVLAEQTAAQKRAARDLAEKDMDAEELEARYQAELAQEKSGKSFHERDEAPPPKKLKPTKQRENKYTRVARALGATEDEAMAASLGNRKQKAGIANLVRKQRNEEYRVGQLKKKKRALEEKKDGQQKRQK